MLEPMPTSMPSSSVKKMTQVQETYLAFPWQPRVVCFWMNDNLKVLFFVFFKGFINLKACKNYKNKFERGMINEFTVEAVDLGDLEKLRIGHDNSGEEREKKDILKQQQNDAFCSCQSLPIASLHSHNRKTVYYFFFAFRQFTWLVLGLGRD